MKILIVDDSIYKQQDITDTLKCLYDMEQLEIMTATTAYDAAKNLENNDFDLIVLDMCFSPRHDAPANRTMGMHVANRIARKGKHTAIIFCSSDEISENVRNCIVRHTRGSNVSILGYVKYDSCICQTSNFAEILNDFCKTEKE